MLVEKGITIAGTAEGARKALETKRKVYGDDVLSRWGKAGGDARSESPKRSNPFKDVEFAREMGRKSATQRWKRYRENKTT